MAGAGVARDAIVAAETAPASAARIFRGLAGSYATVAAILSFGQDPRWRGALVRGVRARPGDRVLDVATGTGLVARALARRYGCSVVGIDQSADMLGGAARGRTRLTLVRGRAERLPFADASFDHVTFTYLLRYVADPEATIRELARVLKPGGRMATLEFALPSFAPWRWLWRLYTRIGLPLLGRLISRRWGDVGDFLGGSIESYYGAHPQSAIEGYWRDAGLVDLDVRTMSLGGGTVMSATKGGTAASGAAPAAAAGASLGSAFYALRPGGWRDYWTLLHPPYTLWHLSYVALGASAAADPDPRIVLGALAAFGLAVGVGAHAFDELRGHPLGTRIPDPLLLMLGTAALALSTLIGIAGATIVGPGLLAFVAVGIALVLGYGLELPGIHSDMGFAISWGAFPVLTAAYALGAPLAPALALAAAAALLSLAQRRLSTRVRAIRRRARAVSGEVRYTDGSVERLDAHALIAAPEAALKLLWVTSVLVGAGALLARWVAAPG